jgi:excinuclease UvrABC nuclease subunit
MKSISSITDESGVYVLCDLDNNPLYVGKSEDSIRNRVRRHLTSARSDIIANRQIDVWEIAYVWAYPSNLADLSKLEAFMFHHLSDEYHLINGTIPKRPAVILSQAPEPSQIVQVRTDEEILARKKIDVRITRQSTHYTNLLDHYLNVKKSPQLKRALNAHFYRLKDNHQILVGGFDLVGEPI